MAAQLSFGNGAAIGWQAYDRTHYLELWQRRAYKTASQQMNNVI